MSTGVNHVALGGSILAFGRMFGMSKEQKVKAFSTCIANDWFPHGLPFVGCCHPLGSVYALVPISRYAIRALRYLNLTSHWCLHPYDPPMHVQPSNCPLFFFAVARFQCGVNPVVVHGGGPQIAAMLKRLDIPTSFVEVSSPRSQLCCVVSTILL